jgi:hypothetical protein
MKDKTIRYTINMDWNWISGLARGTEGRMALNKINISVRYRKLGPGLVSTGMNILNNFSLHIELGL